LKAELEKVERPLRIYETRLTSNTDMRTTLRVSVVNSVLGALASHRSDDLVIAFPETRPLLLERKSVFGIGYTNRLDIDSGTVTLNLRRASIASQRRGELRVFLEMEGQGRISVSGKYAGISGSTSPRIELSLRDTISFLVSSGGEQGTILLRPARGSVILNAKLHVSLLGWEVPWEERIPIQIDKLIPPIELPTLIQTSIKLPVPARDFSDKNYEFAETPFIFSKSRTMVDGNFIRFDSDVIVP
jgi:hypothetical protein